MAKNKKTTLDKENELLEVISDAKKKLAKLQEKQRMQIGDLACKNGLNKFELDVLDDAFKKLSAQLSMKS